MSCCHPQVATLWTSSVPLLVQASHGLARHKEEDVSFALKVALAGFLPTISLHAAHVTVLREDRACLKSNGRTGKSPEEPTCSV